MTIYIYINITWNNFDHTFFSWSVTLSFMSKIKTRIHTQNKTQSSDKSSVFVFVFFAFCFFLQVIFLLLLPKTSVWILWIIFFLTGWGIIFAFFFKLLFAIFVVVVVCLVLFFVLFFFLFVVVFFFSLKWINYLQRYNWQVTNQRL